MSFRKDFKIYDSADEALRGLKSGSSIMAGGFGLAGIPETCIEWCREQDDIKDLYFISTEAGDDEWGLGRLYQKGKIKKQSCSYIGRCKAMEKAYLSGETELELIPQGNLAEKIRSCGSGIPAFYSRTGLHTAYATGELPTLYEKGSPDIESKVLKYCSKKETRKFGDREYLLEEAFPTADYAWIKAKKADRVGNCVFEGTAFNFNAIMAMAAKVTIVEADEIVEEGELRPEEVQLSGLFVNRLFQGFNKHKIEILKYDEGEDEGHSTRDIIAKRAAKEFEPGSACNLGVGMPTLASSYAAKDKRHVFVQSENGVIGVGGYPKKGQENSNWINAGKETIDYIPGASTFGSDMAFAQIRGGHLGMTVLGALECSQYGDIANYMIPGKMVKGMGGAMDLVSHPEATKVLVVQTHSDKHGNPKIKKKCDLPLTGARCVHTIVTELACFDVDPEKGLTLRDYNPNSSIDEIKEKTGAPFQVHKDCKPWEI